IPADLKNPSAGYTPGIARLGIPALQSTDASMGVTNPGYRPDDKGATAFPASIVVGSSFNPQLAREGGIAIAREARSRGFNILLAGAGDGPGVVFRAGGRTGDRRDLGRPGESFRAPADHVPRRSFADATAGAGRPRHAMGHAGDHPL